MLTWFESASHVCDVTAVTDSQSRTMMAVEYAARSKNSGEGNGNKQAWTPESRYSTGRTKAQAKGAGGNVSDAVELLELHQRRRYLFLLQAR
jgi:hypothetical protein